MGSFEHACIDCGNIKVSKRKLSRKRCRKCANANLGSIGSKMVAKAKLIDFIKKIENDELVPKRRLRSYLISKYGEQCSSCKLKEWCGTSIPLEMDHIDGNHFNSRLSNCRILCPNCHALTPTYCRRNKVRYDRKNKCVISNTVD